MSSHPQASLNPSDSEAPLYRKPRADVFTVLLVIALLALILATTVLWLVMGQYDNSIKGGPSVGSMHYANPMVAASNHATGPGGTFDSSPAIHRWVS